ncbi:MAG: hypothetical protein Q4B67_08500 [Eubacteriales bacterium]|nr:hypothetical protein [Eubacteriales bacterium]
MKPSFKKIVLLMLSAVLLTGVLAGCVKFDSNENSRVPTTEAVTTEAAATEVQTTGGGESEGNTETAAEIKASAKTEEKLAQSNMKLPSTFLGVTPEEYEIVNNNGHFVKVGKLIYFHIPDADSMDKSAIWGDYADRDTGRTVLFAYNPGPDDVDDVEGIDAKAGEALPILYDYTSGTIGVEDDFLYSQGYKTTDEPNFNDFVVKGYSYVTGYEFTKETTGAEYFLGASPDGSYTASHHHDYVAEQSTNTISIYRYGCLNKTIVLPEFCTVIKLGNESIYYITEAGNDRYWLMELNIETEEATQLGLLPQYENTGWYGEVDECILKDDGIYLTYSFYEGTGHFLTKGYYVEAVPGEPGSLKFSDMPEKKEYDDLTLAYFAVINGKMVPSDGVPGTCKVDENGVLGYYDENGKWVKVSEGWKYDYKNEEGDFSGVELAEKIGDDIYLIVNDNKRAPEDDIGWRYAYVRNYMNVFRVSIKTGEAELILHQAAPWAD